MSLKYEPCSEPLHILVNKLFLELNTTRFQAAALGFILLILPLFAVCFQLFCMGLFVGKNFRSVSKPRLSFFFSSSALLCSVCKPCLSFHVLPVCPSMFGQQTPSVLLCYLCFQLFCTGLFVGKSFRSVSNPYKDRRSMFSRVFL